ncbi:MAG: hypothetical protein EBU90_06070 [Proteobacteria bacterium]|nr:hypothetical protein [Pseudomonadota bacterium]NBP13974.1 hypothetical protein [bacterium]
MTTFDTEFQKANLNYDRMVSDSFALPYNFESIKIQPNELAVAKTFNRKIEKLYDNLIYLYGLCFVADFNIPRKYEGWIGYAFGEQDLQYYDINYSTQFAQSVLSSTFARSQQAIAFDPPTSEFFSTFAYASNDYIVVYGTFDCYNPVKLHEQTYIDPLSGSFTFQEIAGLATYSNQILYVSDRKYNSLFSYNLKDAISNDYIKSRFLFLNNFIGGRGTSKDKLKFNGIGKITLARDVLVVEDAGNKCFKIYDKELNWVNTSPANTFFNKISSINAMTYSERDHKLYVCGDKELVLFDLTTTYDIISAKSYNFVDLLESSDKFIDIKFAKYDPDIFYMLSQKQLIKKWITKPQKNIGVLDSTVFNNDNFKWLAISNKGNADVLYISALSPDDSLNYAAVYWDNLGLISLLKSNDELSIYSKDDVKINPFEYNTSWVYNKSFRKLLYNLGVLIGNVGYRFYAGENSVGTPVYLYRGYNNFFNTNTVLDTNTFSNVYINENFQAETINRAFKLLFDYQSTILTQIISNKPVLIDLTPRNTTDYQYDPFEFEPRVPVSQDYTVAMQENVFVPFMVLEVPEVDFKGAAIKGFLNNLDFYTANNL